MKVLIYKILFCFIFISTAWAQTKTPPASKSRLIVGIVVDQMRNDFIYRYWDRYGNGGFKRLVNGGYHFKNAHYNYIPTYTGPGHCSIYTGATPRAHGIIANDWFDKQSGKYTYCCEDSSSKTVGAPGKNGWMSPKNQLSSTIGDELKMSSNGKAKVFAVAMKDRSSVLPAGHAANGAFWFDDATGNFISSTWYMQKLPDWLEAFNQKNYTKTYLEKTWTPLYSIDSYTNSIADDNRYEETPNKKDKPVFPYEYSEQLAKNKFGILMATPFGNSITKDLALACLKNEQLGKDEITDLFCISFSSPDKVMHAYGPRSVEVEDVYLRLDKDLEELLNALDKEVGKDNYTVFLTADHGGSDVPNHLLDNKIPAGNIKYKEAVKQLKNYFQTNYSDSTLFLSFSNEQVFINEEKASKLKLDLALMEDKLSAYLITWPGIAEAYPSRIMREQSFVSNDYRTLLQNGFNHKRSGNVCFIYQPGWMDHGDKGTTHGAGYNYDTHIPIIFYGQGIRKGESYSYTTITQIAPTICELLKINQPSATLAEPLNGFLK